jgi:histidyl-tRNA synthetase
MTTKKSQKYNQSALVARHYGFEVEKSLSVSKDAIKTAKLGKKEPKYIDGSLPPIEEVSQLLMNYKEYAKEHGDTPQMLYFDNPATGSHDKLRKRPGEDQVSLHTLGISGSIAESILIKTIDVILKDSGAKNYTLHLNNIGGKESQTQFTRETTAFFRKNISLLNANCRQFFKQGVHTLITEGGDQCKIIKEHAPEPMDFLSEETRKNFGDLIERVEAFQIPYEINPDVLGDLNYSSFTTFKFIEDDTGKVLASGTRYNLLSKKIGLRKEIPAMSANIWLGKSREITTASLDKIEKSRNFILHVGHEAKTATLKLLDLMLENKIYTKHALNRDKVSAQIQLSKKLKSEYIIILGHKEALEGNVMIRDHESKSQKIMSYDGLVDFLKKN